MTARVSMSAAVALAGVCVASGLIRPAPLAAIRRINEEGFRNSQVMDLESWLSDGHGPRITGWPSYDQGADGVIGKLRDWGIANPRKEVWGSFGSGWTHDHIAKDANSGTAIMVEAMRILKATGLPLKRTVRIALQAAEGQGLLGSRGHVENHLADPATMELKPQHAKVTACFNVDSGGGAIRGICLQESEAIRPVFQAWMEPFRDLGMTTLTIRNTRGTDHLGFDAVGVPGFQFIQDPLDCSTRTHHTNMDVYERIVPADAMKSAVIVATFVYHAANRPDMLPREPLPASTRATRR